MKKLPESLLRALDRLDYHKLGLIEGLCLGFVPSSPEIERQQKALYRRHPALKEPIFTKREKEIYDAAIGKGATADQALDKIELLAKARRRRAQKRTRVPAAYARAAAR